MFCKWIDGVTPTRFRQIWQTQLPPSDALYGVTRYYTEKALSELEQPANFLSEKSCKIPKVRGDADA